MLTVCVFCLDRSLGASTFHRDKLETRRYKLLGGAGSLQKAREERQPLLL